MEPESHLPLRITWLCCLQRVKQKACVYACVCLCWRRVGSGDLALVFSSLLIKINQRAFISVKDVEN